MKYTLRKTGQLLMGHGICIGAGGNMSIRTDSVMRISPTGAALYEADDDGYAAICLNTGERIPGSPVPSSEWRFHLNIYRERPDIQAVIHTHAPSITGLMSVKKPEFRPLLAETVADAGRITVLPYLKSGSPSLAGAVTDAVQEAETILLCNHGMINLGSSLKQAYFRCCAMEMAARIFLTAKTAGAPAYLTYEEIQQITEQPLSERHQRMTDEDTA